MPSKSLGLFPASLSTDLLFCLEFVEITNKIETVGDLKARERKGWPWGKTNVFFSAPALRPLSPSALAFARSKKITLQKITVCNEFNSKFEKKVISVAIFEVVIQRIFNVLL